MTARRTVTLTADEALVVDALIASGRYRSDHEVISAGISALRGHEARVETWLREDVLPVAAEMKRRPERALSAEEVFEDIRRRHQERSAGS